MIAMDHDSMIRVLRKAPIQALSALSNNPDRTYVLAGGFIRDTIAGLEPQDIDIFTGDRESGIDISTTPFIQYTYKVFDTPEKLISRFDFACCQAAIWWENGNFHGLMSPYFLPNITDRQLHLAAPTMWNGGAGTFKRMTRFLARGWKIDDYQLGKILDAIHEMMGERDYNGLTFLSRATYDEPPL